MPTRGIPAVTWAILHALVVTTFLGGHVQASDREADADWLVAYAIGDSVLLGASERLRKSGIKVNAVEGRQPARLASAVAELPNDGKPVVIHLGTNGPFSQRTCLDLQPQVEGERDVVFVTVRAPRPWTRKTNTAIRRCSKSLDHVDTELVPWHRIAGIRPELTYSDGIHLRPTGTNILVGEIERALGMCGSYLLRDEPAAQVGRSCPDSA